MSDRENRTPEEVRREIAATRDELADTAAALAAKADVKERARERVEEVKSDVRSRVTDVKETVTGGAQQVKDKVGAASAGGAEGAGAPVAEKAAAAGHAAKEQVRSHPLPSAVIAAALLGFVLGYMAARR